MSIRAIQSDGILELFKKLYNDFNIDDMDVARLEMAYMPYFRFDDKPKCLIRCITKMPELFIEFISIVCKHDDNEEETIPPESENVFRNARYVLDKLNEIPGCSANLINEDVFINWMQRANQIASESGYTKAFECYAGKLLSYSPVGNDGVFPHEIIRSYLESNSSEPLFNNFIAEKRNQRGVHYATWGAEEKLIAQEYKDAASSIRIKYPKTASVLNKLCECYSDESRQGQMMEYGDFSHGY